LPVVLGGFGGILVFKEIADFIQIGLVAYQTGKRFSGQRSFSGGSASIDGGTVRVSIGDASFVLPIEDAATMAGVGGAAAGPRKPAGVAGIALAQLEAKAAGGDVTAREWLERTGYVRNPTPGDPGTTVSRAPDLDRRPFSLREYAMMQNLAIQRGQERKIQAELELELVRGQFAERIAGARNEVQREELRGQLAARERELLAKILLAREDRAAEAAAQGRLFAQQQLLQEREQLWKTSEARGDREWRERTQAEAAEIGFYRKNLAADLALGRSLEAARKIKDLIGDYGKAAQPVVSFASGFAQGV